MGSRPRKGGYRMEGLHMMIRMVLMVALLSAPFPQPGLASDIPRAAERHRACRPGTGTRGRAARAVQSRLGASGAGFL